MAKKAKCFDGVIELLESEIEGRSLDGRFCEALARAFDAELASILDYDSQSHSLRFRYSMDLTPEEQARYFIRLGEGVCGVAAYKTQTISVRNPTEISSAAASIARETGRGVSALLAAPAVRDGRCVAVIEILNPRSGSFAEEDKMVLRMLAALYASRRPESRSAARGKPGSVDLPDEPAIIGASPALESSLRIALKAAPTDIPVLILGESGTGKELFARRIHETSARADRPFVAINCAALSETLLESELFGHERGAFTGAHASRRGRLEDARSGTVFLDEIGDMSAACQAKLLRTLDRGEICPVGSNEVRRIDARFIAATNRPLEAMVTNGAFRADLYYRLSGVNLRLAPLRERQSDIPLLAEVFLRRAAERVGRVVRGFSPAALRALQSYSWPGNVRELHNAIEQVLMMTEREEILADDLPASLRCEATSKVAELDDALASHILQALRETSYAGSGRWNVAEAARQLGLPRKTLDYQIRKFGLTRGG